MNESTRTPLKTLVERAVRPVRASMSRKQKMREELLGHVSAVFEAESKAFGDQRAALERTEQRFGCPTELSGQLQESVPVSDLFYRFVDSAWFRPGESRVRLLLRHGFWQLLILMAFLPAWYVWAQGSGWVVRVSEWPPDEPRSLFGGPVLLFDWFFFMFSAVILVWGLVSLDRRMAAKIRSHQEWQSLEID
jgi:hypothetical protein